MAGTRYLRYIIFAVVCLTVLFFISSSSTTPTTTNVTQQVQTATDILRDKWRGSKVSTPAKVPDAHDLQSQLKDEIKQEIELIPQPPAQEAEKSTNTPPSAHGGSGLAPEDVVPGSPQAAHQTKPESTSSPASGRMNATFVTLARNGDVWEIAKSIRQVEDRFNHKFHYDWVFLNDQPFNEEFRRVTTKLVSGRTRYGLIGEEHWSFPDHIDQEKAAAVRADFGARKIIYGDSISYRHMCRFESGFFYRQPLMLEYEWYWRVEPSIKLFCDVDYDVFKFMADNDKKYGFVLSLYEYKETIETLWDSVKTFMKEHPEHIAANNSMEWLSDDGGKEYNRCHFWSNFEVGNLNWLRSKAYSDYFDRLDKDGGFFYERWGDAPVHSIAAGLLLNRDQIHFFNDIGYWHVPFSHCPAPDTLKNEGACHCNPKDNFDWNGYSCTAKFFDLHGMPHPEVFRPYNPHPDESGLGLWLGIMMGTIVILGVLIGVCSQGLRRW